MSAKRSDVFLEKYKIPQKPRIETEEKQLKKVDWAAWKAKVQKRYDEGSFKETRARRHVQRGYCKEGGGSDGKGVARKASTT